ncbi:MAG TPA: cytochrome c oxidase assembly protein [Bryobacteraceae bacterium]|nr:cytochrome c oxidase assembly protein [Bryobacteraceae bacterium]
MRRKSAILVALGPMPAFAHTGEPFQAHDLWRAWSFEPWVVVPLALTALLYLKGDRASHRSSIWKRAAFWAGWTVLAASLISPLHSLGQVLFSAHMTQHELLMLIAAPLLAYSRPLVPFLWGVPFSWRRALGRWSKRPTVQKLWHALTNPLTAWWQHAAVLWIWHAPALFQATLSSEWVHACQHICFLGSALLFWWSLFYAHRWGGYGAGVLYVFTTAAHTSVLGALLTFAPRVWYPAYASRVRAWGWDPLQDQQLGGLIMWVPAGVIYLVLGLALFAVWLRESDSMISPHRLPHRWTTIPRADQEAEPS